MGSVGRRSLGQGGMCRRAGGLGMRRWRRGRESVAVVVKIAGAQTSSLVMGGRVRISHPYICQTESAMAMRLCMTEHYWAQRMVPGPPNGKSQEGRSRGVQLVESGLGSRRGGRDQFTKKAASWLVSSDLQMTAQPASSHGRGEEFGKRRRASARRPEWDAGRELSYAACAKKGPSLGQDDLTMEPETTIRSR